MPMPRPLLILAFSCLPLLVGCEGCRRGDEVDEDPAQQTPLQDFTAGPALAFPADAIPARSGIKPGHWLTASQGIKSNNSDVRGELRSSSTIPPAATLDAGPDVGGSLDHSAAISSLRPVVLPKGQNRRFQYRLLAPRAIPGDRKTALLDSRLVSSGRALLYDVASQPISLMSSEEYFFVVLTTRPERFAKLMVADWVRPFRNEVDFSSAAGNYRIVIPKVDSVLPLSETMLDWTSTAVVLWDDLSPDALMPRQQQALADWLHFGGTLIVNGAEAAETIDQTSVSGLLALQPSGNIELDPDSGAELLTKWAVPSDRSTEKQIALLRDQTARVAVDGKLAEDAQAVTDTGDLVVERRLGRGRVVQSRFDLTSDWLSTWASYDSFINAVMLRRPHRKFVEVADVMDESLVRQTYATLGTPTATAATNTRFRIAARDARLPLPPVADTVDSAPDAAPPDTTEPVIGVDPLASVHPVAGIGGWTDDSDLISLCRNVLRSEAGISIPDSSLVMRLLGYYLVLLVPVNYLIFRLWGRLEYAWLAVPVIALVGAVWVARAARLDIGFARSQTELAVLELQPDYPRGHLSRVVAIYNSLSSRYDVSFQTPDAAAAPVVADQDDRGTELTFRNAFDEGPTLSGLAVGSSQIRMLHAEQVVDIGGVIRRQGDTLINASTLELQDVFVIEKAADGSSRVAVVGGCAPGEQNSLRFRDARAVTASEELPMQAALLIRRLGTPASMPAGSTRLVGRVSQTLEGMTITPIANQAASQTIVLAHLQHGALPQARPDVNLISDFRQVQTDPLVPSTSGGSDDEAVDYAEEL